MPRPLCEDETNGEWMSRCILEVMDEGLDHDEAVGRCAGMWNTYCDEQETLDLDEIYGCPKCKNAMSLLDWFENLDHGKAVLICPKCSAVKNSYKDLDVFLNGD